MLTDIEDPVNTNRGRPSLAAACTRLRVVGSLSQREEMKIAMGLSGKVSPPASVPSLVAACSRWSCWGSSKAACAGALSGLG